MLLERMALELFGKRFMGVASKLYKQAVQRELQEVGKLVLQIIGVEQQKRSVCIICVIFGCKNTNKQTKRNLV